MKRFCLLPKSFTSLLLVGCIHGAWPGLVSASPGPTTQWLHQFGAAGGDTGVAVSVDGIGNSYFVGSTAGGVVGGYTLNPGMFLAKYGPAGGLLWAEQLEADDGSVGVYSVSAGATGDIYLTGSTSASLAGQNQGGFDVYLARFDTHGSHVWTQQLGSTAGDYTFDVMYADSGLGAGSVYMTGYTNGSFGEPVSGDGRVFLAGYDTSGALDWATQLEGSYGDGIGVDGAGNVYLAGRSSTGDAFLMKFDSSGGEIWSRTLGTPTSAEAAYALTVNEDGTAYLAGHTNGQLAGTGGGTPTGREAFLARYDANGNLDWVRQPGPQFDVAFSVVADEQGNAYIGGIGSLDSENSSSSGNNAVIAKYDIEGNLIWIDQLEITGDDYSRIESLALDDAGNIFFAGQTDGVLGEENFGGVDGFIGVLSDPFISGTPGDLNGDGFVGVGDLDVLLANWGDATIPGLFSAGDLSGDGVVGQADLDIVLAAWGDGTPPGSDIPEPGSLAFFAVGARLLVHRRRRV